MMEEDLTWLLNDYTELSHGHEMEFACSREENDAYENDRRRAAEIINRVRARFNEPASQPHEAPENFLTRWYNEG